MLGGEEVIQEVDSSALVKAAALRANFTCRSACDLLK